MCKACLKTDRTFILRDYTQRACRRSDPPKSRRSSRSGSKLWNGLFPKSGQVCRSRLYTPSRVSGQNNLLSRTQIEKQFVAKHGYPEAVILEKPNQWVLKLSGDRYWRYRFPNKFLPGTFERISKKEGRCVEKKVARETIKKLSGYGIGAPNSKNWKWDGTCGNTPPKLRLPKDLNEPLFKDEFRFICKKPVLLQSQTLEHDKNDEGGDTIPIANGNHPGIIRWTGIRGYRAKDVIWFAGKAYGKGNRFSRIAYSLDPSSKMTMYHFIQEENGCVAGSIVNAYYFMSGSQVSVMTMVKLYHKLKKSPYGAPDGGVNLYGLSSCASKGKIPGFTMYALPRAKLRQALKNRLPVVAATNNFGGHALHVESISRDGKVIGAIDSLTGIKIYLDAKTGKVPYYGCCRYDNSCNMPMLLPFHLIPTSMEYYVMKITDPDAFFNWVNQ